MQIGGAISYTDAQGVNRATLVKAIENDNDPNAPILTLIYINDSGDISYATGVGPLNMDTGFDENGLPIPPTNGWWG